MNIDNLFRTGQQLDEPDSPWLQYVLLRAVGKFQSENGTYPGFYDDNVELDIGKLKVIRVDTHVGQLDTFQGFSFNYKVSNIFRNRVVSPAFFKN